MREIKCEDYECKGLFFRAASRTYVTHRKQLQVCYRARFSCLLRKSCKCPKCLATIDMLSMYDSDIFAPKEPRERAIYKLEDVKCDHEEKLITGKLTLTEEQ